VLPSRITRSGARLATRLASRLVGNKVGNRADHQIEYNHNKVNVMLKGGEVECRRKKVWRNT